MLYCDYEKYIALGGKMDAGQYDIFGPRASRAIDRLTFGRAAAYASASPEGDTVLMLADACAQMADVLCAQAEGQAAGAGVTLASFNNDGYSETYTAAGAAQRACWQRLRGILRDALGADEENLLYGGCC